MSTYITGVTDYIPDYQTFQPDLNFYAHVLQTKQSQYDSNYKALNNLYGELYHQRVTRDDSNKLKDDYLKKVDYELKRVSALDLSLQQNVDQATQVFKPLYEDAHLMKDMALTKNYDNERSRAVALKNAKDPKVSAGYWNNGVKAMDYRLEEFKNAAKEDVLSFGNITYTPNVNAFEKYKEIAESMDLSVDITQPDKSGMYLVRQKNGDLILPSIQKMFLSAYASDPSLQAKYATDAYVKRKDEIKGRAEKYKGNELLAEQEYLKEQYVILKDYTNEKTKASEEVLDANKSKANIVKNDVDSGKVNVKQPAFMERINQALQVDKIVYEHNSKLNEQINRGNSSPYTDKPVPTVDGLDLENIELAREMVDSNLAAYLAEKDILLNSDIFAKKDMIVDYKANPFGLEQVRHSHNMSRDAANNAAAINRDKTKFERDLILKKVDADNDLIKYKLENGFAYLNEKGEVVPIPTPGQTLEEIEAGDTAIKNIGILKDNRNLFLEDADKNAGEYFNHWLDNIRKGIDSQEIKKADLAYLLGQNNKWVDKIWEKYNNQSETPEGRKKLVQELTLGTKMFDLKKRMDTWAEKHDALETAQSYNSNQLALFKLDQVQLKYSAHMQIKKENDNRIQKQLYAALAETNLSDKAKYSIIDAYQKQYITGKLYHDEDFDDYIEDFLDKTGEGNKTAVVKTTWKNTEMNEANARFAPGPTKTVNKIPFAQILSDAYDKITTNPNHKLGLLSYRKTNVDANTGRATVAARPSSVPVNLGRRDENLISFKQFVQDIKGINFLNDPTNFRISTKGNVLDPKYDSDYLAENQSNLKKLKNMMFDLAALSNNKAQKDKPDIFKLIQHQVGMEDSGLGAMTVGNIPQSVIDKYFDKKEDAAIINEIKANGITFMAPQSNWRNNLYQSNKITPTESIMNTGKGLSFVDPSYGHNYVVRRDNVTGNYSITGKINSVDDNGKPIVYSLSETVPYGNNIDDKISKIMIDIHNTNVRLKQVYTNFHNLEDTQKKMNMEKAFGKSFKNAGLKII